MLVKAVLDLHLVCRLVFHMVKMLSGIYEKNSKIVIKIDFSKIIDEWRAWQVGIIFNLNYNI